MKRKALAIALAIAVFCLSACGPLVTDEGKTLTVYATFYPIYALTDALMADVPDMALHCLVQPQDGCLRSYALSDWDVCLLASSADAVIAGGRGFEAFESTLFSMGDAGPAVSAVLYNLELHNGSTSHVGTDEDSHLNGPNPHLYMSIAGAKQLVDAIGAMLMTLDPRYAAQYSENITAAETALDDLAAKTQALLSPYAGERVALMNEALIYVSRDYGLDVAAWIDRESGEGLYGDALDDCLDRLSRCGARVVLIERQAPKALVDALSAEGYRVASVDVLSTHAEGEGFESYLEAQLQNAQSIRSAFENAAQEVNP